MRLFRRSRPTDDPYEDEEEPTMEPSTTISWSPRGSLHFSSPDVFYYRVRKAPRHARPGGLDALDEPQIWLEEAAKVDPFSDIRLHAEPRHRKPGPSS
jgi:hypothetical protein